MSTFGKITVLGNDPEAERLLREAANQVTSIMAKRKWRVGVLEEFCPSNAGLLGLNVNHGQRIKVRMRSSPTASTFLPSNDILGTLLHELVHIVLYEVDGLFWKPTWMSYVNIGSALWCGAVILRCTTWNKFWLWSFQLRFCALPCANRCMAHTPLNSTKCWILCGMNAKPWWTEVLYFWLAVYSAWSCECDLFFLIKVVHLNMLRFGASLDFRNVRNTFAVGHWKAVDECRNIVQKSTTLVFHENDLPQIRVGR